MPELNVACKVDMSGIQSAYPQMEPLKLDKKLLRSKLGEYGKVILDRIKDLQKDGIFTHGAKPYHLWSNNSGKPKITPFHTDRKAGLLLQLCGSKTIYVGTDPGEHTAGFIDYHGKKWMNEKSGDASGKYSNVWSLEDNGSEPNCKEFTHQIIQAGCFKPFNLCAGDALLVPRRYLHGVITKSNSLMVSIILNERMTKT